jgi:hypothetical protein
MRRLPAHAGVVAGEFRGEVASFYARYRRGYPAAFTGMLARALRLGPSSGARGWPRWPLGPWHLARLCPTGDHPAYCYEGRPGGRPEPVHRW